MEDLGMLCQILDSKEKVERVRTLVEMKRKKCCAMKFCCTSKSFLRFLNVVGEGEKQLEHDMFLLVSSYLIGGTEFISSIDPQLNNKNFRTYAVINKYAISLDDSPTAATVSLRQVVSNFPLLVAAVLSDTLGKITTTYGSLNGLPKCLAFPWGINMIPTTPPWEPLSVLWKMWKQSYPHNILNSRKPKYMALNYFCTANINREMLMSQFGISPPTPDEVVHKIEDVLNRYRYGNNYTAFEIIFEPFEFDIWTFYCRNSKQYLSSQTVGRTKSSDINSMDVITTDTPSLNYNPLPRVKSSSRCTSTDHVVHNSRRCISADHAVQSSQTEFAEKKSKQAESVSISYDDFHQLKDLILLWQEQSQDEGSPTTEENSAKSMDCNNNFPHGGTAPRKATVNKNLQNGVSLKGFKSQSTKQKAQNHYKTEISELHDLCSGNIPESVRTRRNKNICIGINGMKTLERDDGVVELDLSSAEYRTLRDSVFSANDTETKKTIPKRSKQVVQRRLLKNDTVLENGFTNKAEVMQSIVRNFFSNYPLPMDLYDRFSLADWEFPDLGNLTSHLHGETGLELNRITLANSWEKIYSGTLNGLPQSKTDYEVREDLPLIQFPEEKSKTKVITPRKIFANTKYDFPNMKIAKITVDEGVTKVSTGQRGLEESSNQIVDETSARDDARGCSESKDMQIGSLKFTGKELDHQEVKLKKKSSELKRPKGIASLASQIADIVLQPLTAELRKESERSRKRERASYYSKLHSAVKQYGINEDATYLSATNIPPNLVREGFDTDVDVEVLFDSLTDSKREGDVGATAELDHGSPKLKSRDVTVISVTTDVQKGPNLKSLESVQATCLSKESTDSLKVAKNRSLCQTVIRCAKRLCNSDVAKANEYQNENSTWYPSSETLKIAEGCMYMCPSDRQLQEAIDAFFPRPFVTPILNGRGKPSRQILNTIRARTAKKI